MLFAVCCFLSLSVVVQVVQVVVLLLCVLLYMMDFNSQVWVLCEAANDISYQVYVLNMCSCNNMKRNSQTFVVVVLLLLLLLLFVPFVSGGRKWYFLIEEVHTNLSMSLTRQMCSSHLNLISG